MVQASRLPTRNRQWRGVARRFMLAFMRDALVPVVVAVLVCSASGAASADARKPVLAGYSITRQQAPAAEDAPVADLLVGSDWIEFNPEKKTSVYESTTYTFAADGTVTITRNNLGGPVASQSTWTALSHARVKLGARTFTIAACRRSDTDHTICLIPPSAPRHRS